MTTDDPHARALPPKAKRNRKPTDAELRVMCEALELAIAHQEADPRPGPRAHDPEATEVLIGRDRVRREASGQRLVVPTCGLSSHHGVVSG